MGVRRLRFHRCYILGFAMQTVASGKTRGERENCKNNDRDPAPGCDVYPDARMFDPEHFESTRNPIVSGLYMGAWNDTDHASHLTSLSSYSTLPGQLRLQGRLGQHHSLSPVQCSRAKQIAPVGRFRTGAIRGLTSGSCYGK